MNPILIEIYSTILPSAPYFILAYVLLILALFVFAFTIYRSQKKSEKQLELIEESIADLKS